MWNAEEYNTGSEMQNSLNDLYLPKYITRIGGNHLDAGCGNGRTTHKIASLKPKTNILAIDSCNNMLRFAEENYANDNITYQHCPVEKLNYSNHFNSITSLFCLHWVNDLKLVIENFHQALKKDGMCFVIIPQIPQKMQALFKLLTASEQAVLAKPMPALTLPYNRSLEVCMQCFKEAKFKINAHYTHDTSLTFASFNDYWKFISALPIINARYNKQERLLIYNEFKRRHLIKHKENAKDVISHPDLFSIIMATK